MGRDPASWFRVQSSNGALSFKNVIDRESIYVINGVYKAEVLAITRGKKIVFIKFALKCKSYSCYPILYKNAFSQTKLSICAN